MAGAPPNGSSGNDDDLEISVEGRQLAPAATSQQQQARKRARTPNPAADEVIHTGEIGDSGRSLIIRSSQQSVPLEPKIQIREEPTEPVVPVPPPRMAVPMAPPRSNRTPLIIGAAVVVLAGVGVAIGLSSKGSGKAAAGAQPAAAVATPSASIAPLAEFIGTTLDADGHAAMVRAEAIASSSMLRAGIETDAKTVQDMAKDNDVTFSLKPGEVIEVIQIRDGARTTLLHWPTDGAHIPAPPAAGKMQLAQMNNQLAVVATAEIPKRAGSHVGGEIVIAVPVDIEVIRKKVTIPSSIVGLATPIVIVGGAATATKQTVKIDTEMKSPISLEASP